MDVGELLAALSEYDEGLPVFFRCHAPVVGNVREVGSVEVDTFAVFGKPSPCVIIDVDTE